MVRILAWKLPPSIRGRLREILYLFVFGLFDLIKGMYSVLFISRKPANGATPSLFVVIPTYKGDFGILKSNLKSLFRLTDTMIAEVIIYSDRHAPLTGAMKESLDQLSAKVRHCTLPLSYKSGFRRILCNYYMMGCLLRRKEVSNKDYFVKMDSDILWFSNQIFRDIHRGIAEIIGARAQAPGSNREYTQGGIYAIRVSRCRENFGTSTARKYIREPKSYLPSFKPGWKSGEDLLMFIFFSHRAEGVLLNEYLLSPCSIRTSIKSADLSRNFPGCSGIHYEGNLNDKMHEDFDNWF